MLRYMRRITLITADTLAVIMAAILAYAILPPEQAELDGAGVIYPLLAIYSLNAAFGLCYFGYRGHYSWRCPWWQQVKQVGLYCLVAALINILTNYVILSALAGQLFLAAIWLLAVPSILAFRLLGRFILKKMHHWDIATVLVGNAQNIIDTIIALKSEFFLTYDIKYVVVPNAADSDIAAINENCPGIEIRDALDDIHSHSMVVLCPGDGSHDFVHQTVARIKAAGAKFAIVPPMGAFSVYGLQPQYFFGYNIVLMESQYRLRTFSGALTKQVLDRAMALIGLILLAPVFAILIWKVRQDGGPAFYGQRRVGRDGKEFRCWKFRSMVTNSEEVLKHILETDPAAREEWAKDFKLKNDPRITKIGNFLRKSSLDEIPQLYNVLCGEMSIVGPRPVVKAEEVYYGDSFANYKSVRPGITGLWQVSGRNDVTYEQRVSLDNWYVENWSVWNDLVIIFKTSFVVLYRKGAY